MNPRTVLLALAALLTAGVTAFLVHGWMDRQRAQIAAPAVAATPKAAARSVLVAKTDMGSGSFVQPGDIRWQAWPEGDLSPSYAVKGEREAADFVGSVVRTGIVAGQPITDRSVVKAGERGFLAAVLQPGMRAVAVPVTAASAIAGLVFPGDRVDLILTHKFQGGTGGNQRKARQASETVLTNVRILAIDQKTDDQNKGDAKVPKTATVEVTPKQAEIVNVALTLGKLSLSLRSLANSADEAEAGTPDPAVTRRGRSVTRDSEVSGLLAVGGGDAVTVLRGSGK